MTALVSAIAFAAVGGRPPLAAAARAGESPIGSARAAIEQVPLDRSPNIPPDDERRAPLRGLVVPARSADLAAARDGVVKAVHARLGAEVRKGELVAELVPSDATSDVAIARAALAVCRAERAFGEEERSRATARLRHVDRLAREGLAPREEVASLQGTEALAQRRAAVLEAAESRALAELERRVTEVEARRLRAPFDGIVARVNAESGERAVMGTPLLRLVSRAMRVRFGVPRGGGTCARVGETLRVTGSTANEVIRARVIAVAPEIDAEAGLVWVEADPIEVPAWLTPGMRTSIESDDGAERCVR